MAHQISGSSSTESGTYATTTERTCVEIYIDVDPRRPKGLRLYFADVTEDTFTPAAGGAPMVTVTDVNPVGMIPVSDSEMVGMSVFPATYAALKALADAKALIQWPELAAQNG